MKILHVIADLDERVGGPPRNVATLARAQADRGDDIVQGSAGTICPTRVEPFETALRAMLSGEAYRRSCGRAALALSQRFAPAVVAGAPGIRGLYRGGYVGRVRSR